jgi:hypothetical protein
MTRILVAAAAALALTCTLAACGGGDRAAAVPAERSATGFVRPAGMATLYYAEIYKQETNRFYVFGTKLGFESFKASHEIPISRTVINYGPSGETVQFEADKDGPQLTERLKKDFAARWNLAAK